MKLSITSQNSDVEKELRSTLLWVNKQLESHQKIDCLIICREPWTIDNDLITPTLKIKRNLIEQKYSTFVAKDISADIIWYSDEN